MLRVSQMILLPQTYCLQVTHIDFNSSVALSQNQNLDPPPLMNSRGPSKQWSLKNLGRWCSLYSRCSAGGSCISMSIEGVHTLNRERPTAEVGLCFGAYRPVFSGQQLSLLPFASLIGSLWSFAQPPAAVWHLRSGFWEWWLQYKLPHP